MCASAKVDKLMIVAHPDDEAIFGGGALVSEPGWKVICLANGSSRTRSREFRKAMEYAGADGEIWDYPDVYGGSFDKERVEEDLREVLDSKRFYRVVTHNPKGEYGHTQHKALSRIVRGMHVENLHFFGTADTPLPFHVLRRKLNLLNIYASQHFVIEQLMDYILYESIVPADS
ncbi:PIG-L family deacetylase [Paenibacillus thermotolerans]|uniref:PIG-L family deacetylase n=1 Tax=Paenibacillus thermotolerans TaxID=3027807 RepID=UPI002368AC69|nr:MULTISPECIES: PIG-L family deacetylase [unclassified Paenibacillus]